MKEKHIQNEELVFNMIQGQIGYDFKNLDLLKQAFVRRSYTEENGGEDNEVLEFIGDKVLDVIVVKLLTQKFGRLDNNDLVSSFTSFFLWILSIWFHPQLQFRLFRQPLLF